MNKLERVIILIAVFALVIPALSAAKMAKHEEKTTSTQMMDKRDAEMMHSMMPGMMRDMMDTMHEMMGMMKGYDETMKKVEDTGDKMAGDVTVDVTYLNPGEESPAFNIKLDTHSSNLDQYKLEAIVSLRDEKGKEYANPAVESPSGSGHHRSGVVRFKGVDISRATAIELVIKDMGGAKERIFRFDIK